MQLLTLGSPLSLQSEHSPYLRKQEVCVEEEQFVSSVILRISTFGLYLPSIAEGEVVSQNPMRVDTSIVATLARVVK